MEPHWSIDIFRSETLYLKKKPPTFCNSDQKFLTQFFAIPIDTLHFQKLLIMAGPSSISSALSNDAKVINPKILFGHSFDIQKADNDLLNKYVIYKFNQYAEMNVEDYCLWDSIQMYFAKFEARHFNELDNPTWRIVRDYCYMHRFWINHNNGPNRTHTTFMLKVVDNKWNNKWTLEHISCIEKCYNHILSRTTCKCKEDLTGIQYLASDLAPITTNLRELSVEP